MGWLTNLFSAKEKQTEPVATATSTETPKSFIMPIGATVNIVPLYCGLDTMFVNFLYFSTPEAKAAYIASVIKCADKLKLVKANGWVEYMKLINDCEDKPPFFKNSLLNRHIAVTKKDGVELNRQDKGLAENHVSFYDTLNIIQYNLERKQENDVTDFTKEEQLLESTLDKQHMNFARLQILQSIALAFHKSGNATKRDDYFNRIKADKYDLSPATVSQFYKEIGQFYLEIRQPHKTIEWFEAGIELNPKLAVKKHLQHLKKEQN